MDTKYLEKLEFNKIIEKLKGFCCTYRGKELANTLTPTNQKEIVEKLLNETR